MKEECPLCGTETSEVLASHLRRGTGVVLKCAKCDLGFLVSEEKTDYRTGYRNRATHKADGSGGTPEEIYRTYFPFQQKRLDLVRPHVKPDSSVLEIGASAGQFISQLRCARRCAIEPDEDARRFMAEMGISVDERRLPESFFAQDRFDVVCAFQVLEHVDDPVRFLQDVRLALKSDGVAFIEVPNLYDALRSTWALPEYERFYFHADHLWYFSADSLKSVARMAGFEKAEVTFTQDYSLLNHLHWLMNKAPQADCRVGLGPIVFSGENPQLAFWLSDAMQKIGKMYEDYLVSERISSNLLMDLRLI